MGKNAKKTNLMLAAKIVFSGITAQIGRLKLNIKQLIMTILNIICLYCHGEW